jgi:archaellum component FlaC
MPIEDRVTTLEQQFMSYMADNNRQMTVFNRVIAQQELNIRDVEKNETILLGIATSQEHEIKQIKTRLDGIDHRLERVEQRLDGTDQRLERIDQRLDGMDQRLERIDQRLDTIVALLGGKPPISPEP